MVLRLAQSSERAALLCRGRGLEPRLELDPPGGGALLEFGPILPHSAPDPGAASGHERSLVLHNPCDFPVEVYSLEFDQNYLQEEKVGVHKALLCSFPLQNAYVLCTHDNLHLTELLNQNRPCAE